jgi:hypothetical protein
MLARVAAVTAAGIDLLIVLFQIALIAGAPWGQLTQGGYAEGALPVAGRAFAAVSVLVIVAFALGQLGRVGWGPLRGRRRLSTGLTWAALIYSLLGFGMNLASPSSLERAVWAPVCLILAACAAMVLAGTQCRRPNAK